jgi:LPS sulfotransferase NodH
MARRFDAFVIFAEMRTGSNHLEESLNRLGDVVCHGEIYNPVFIGREGRSTLAGYDMDRREADPRGLLAALIEGERIAGFRFFHDHDPRMVEPILSDPRIAKIVLTRNPLDAYLSRTIAAETGQWRLTDLADARSARVRFDPSEFEAMLGDWTAFRARIERGLQVTGQTAFRIRYEDINDIGILNGLASFLGAAGRLGAASRRLKRQNPDPPRDKVRNAAEMEQALGRLDPFALDRDAEAEPDRAPGVPGFVAHPGAGLVFLPVAGAPVAPVLDWMAGIGGVGSEALVTGMSQKDLRRWLRTRPGHLAFTVLRDPLSRVRGAFARLADPQSEGDAERRELLSARYGIAFDGPEGFGAFMTFLKGNLAGQTSLGIRPDWASQAAILHGAARVLLPRRILKEEEMARGLAEIAAGLGLDAPAARPEPQRPPDTDPETARSAFDVYRRDYVQFGFEAPD